MIPLPIIVLCCGLTMIMFVVISVLRFVDPYQEDKKNMLRFILVSLPICILTLVWLVISALMPLEKISRNKHPTTCIDNRVGLIYKEKFYNLNKMFGMSLGGCREVYIVKYKHGYFGINWGIKPEIKLIPKEEPLLPIPEKQPTLAPLK